MSFLKAEWRKLAIANYIIDPDLLAEYIPFGTELDLWQGKCYVSLIGFMFLNTKVLGVRIPFHVNFEEVNLRFYVRRKEKGEWKRGVVFLQEIVPKPAIAFIANTLYSENYISLPMDHRWDLNEKELSVEYAWTRKQERQTISVLADSSLSKITKGSEEEFITEHYWGYAKVNEKKTNEYEVTHPKWEMYRVIDYKINVDFKLNYGSAFSFLNDAEPASVMLAEGSVTTVEKKKGIRG